MLQPISRRCAGFGNDACLKSSEFSDCSTCCKVQHDCSEEQAARQTVLEDAGAISAQNISMIAGAPGPSEGHSSIADDPEDCYRTRTDSDSFEKLTTDLSCPAIARCILHCAIKVEAHATKQ